MRVDERSACPGETRWSRRHKVRIDFTRPGKPTDNGHVETFNGSLRDECLNGHRFESLAEARASIEARRRDNNQSWPHMVLGSAAPGEYARKSRPLADRPRAMDRGRGPTLRMVRIPRADRLPLVSLLSRIATVPSAFSVTCRSPCICRRPDSRSSESAWSSGEMLTIRASFAAPTALMTVNPTGFLRDPRRGCNAAFGSPLSALRGRVALCWPCAESAGLVALRSVRLEAGAQPWGIAAESGCAKAALRHCAGVCPVQRRKARVNDVCSR